LARIIAALEYCGRGGDLPETGETCDLHSQSPLFKDRTGTKISNSTGMLEGTP
jgi:hypothetical protein